MADSVPTRLSALELSDRANLGSCKTISNTGSSDVAMEARRNSSTISSHTAMRATFWNAAPQTSERLLLAAIPRHTADVPHIFRSPLRRRLAALIEERHQRKRSWGGTQTIPC